MKKYKFKPGWTASVGFILLMPLFIALGVWQLHRAEEKRGLLELRERQERQPPIRLSGAERMLEAFRFRPIEVEGDYDAHHQFLLDNQFFKHQPGYHVLTPLKLSGSDVAVLVNRGWLPVGPDRRRLPELPIAETRVRIRGTLDRFPMVGFKLEGAEVPAPGWPALVQVLNADSLMERLGYRVLPYQVLLADAESQGYTRDWHASTPQPEKSRSYALQWFSFAITLTGLYLWYGFKPASRE